MSVLSVNNVALGEHELSPESFRIVQDLTNNQFVDQLRTLDSLEVRRILKCCVQQMVQEGQIVDLGVFLDRFTSYVPFEKLQEAVRENVPDVLKEAKDMFDEAKLYLQIAPNSPSYSVQKMVSSLLEGALSLTENMLVAFGVGDLLRPVDERSQDEANWKIKGIMRAFELFTLIATAILPLSGLAAGGLVVAGLFVLVTLLSLLWPFIKPITVYLPGNAENLTREIQNGTSVPEGRKESLNEIAGILKMNRHAILVGPSRVGKSLTARAFAQAVERGDYPELKGKCVFLINTTELLEPRNAFRNGSGVVNNISALMGRHRNDIILVLDEIHMACKNDEKTADKLKTYLDEGGAFPHVIGITTDEEYEAHVKENNAFSLRFDKVEIKNTDKDETLKILSNTVLKSSAKPLLSEGVLEHIYTKSQAIENAPQPMTSLRMLKRCINRTGKTQKSNVEQRVTEVSNRILSCRAQGAASRGKRRAGFEVLAQLEKQLEDLKVQLSNEQLELERLFKSKELLDNATKTSYQSVMRLSERGRSEQELARFLLLREFVSPALEDYIRSKSAALGVKIIVDEALVDTLG